MSQDLSISGPAGVDAPRVATPSPDSGRRRTIAFRVVAWLVAAWVLARSVFGLTEIVFMWLPAETVGNVVGAASDQPEIAEHRIHFFAIGVVAWGTLLASLVQLRRPERRVGSMVLLLVSAVTSWVVFALNGTLAEWLLEDWSLTLPVLLLAFLHPARHRFFRWSGADRRQLVLALSAAVPWLCYAVVSAAREITRASGEHATLEHWALVAMLGTMLPAAALIGAGHVPGWKLPAWYAASASVLVGVHALVFPGLASGLWPPFAVAAIAWGVAYAAAIVLRARRHEAA
jgi:hypothetical protein